MTLARLMKTLVPLAALTGLATAQQAQPEDDLKAQVRASVDGAIKRFDKDLRSAREVLDETFDKQRQKLTRNRGFSAKQLLQLRHDMDAGLEEFLDGGAAFQFDSTEAFFKKINRQLRKAYREYDRLLDQAADQLRASYREASQRYAQARRQNPKDDDLKFELGLEEELREVVRSRSAPPAVPPFVAANIRALRTHRDGFTRRIADELDAVIAASTNGDPRAFQGAVRAAAAATQSKDAKPYVKQDVLTVLAALQRGEWDLSKVELSGKRNRGKVLLGVNYEDH